MPADIGYIKHIAPQLIDARADLLLQRACGVNAVAVAALEASLSAENDLTIYGNISTRQRYGGAVDRPQDVGPRAIQRAKGVAAGAECHDTEGGDEEAAAFSHSTGNQTLSRA